MKYRTTIYDGDRHARQRIYMTPNHERRSVMLAFSPFIELVDMKAAAAEVSLSAAETMLVELAELIEELSNDAD